MKSWNPSMLLPESLPGEAVGHEQNGPWRNLPLHCASSTGDMLGPPLADVPLPPTSSTGPQGEHMSPHAPLPPSSSSSLSSSSSSSSSSTCSSSEAKEQKKNSAKKKCLYNFQDAFMETNRVVMATSASTSSVSCTATTVQSSNNPPSKRPNSIGNIGSRSSGEVCTDDVNRFEPCL